MLLLTQVAYTLQAETPPVSASNRFAVPNNVCAQHYDEFAVVGSPHSSFTWALYVNGTIDNNKNYGEVIYGGEKTSLGEWDPNRNGDTIRVYWKNRYKELNVDVKLVVVENTIGGCMSDPVEVKMKYYSPDLDLGDRNNACIGTSVELQNISADKFFGNTYKWSFEKVGGEIIEKIASGTDTDLSVTATDKIYGNVKVSLQATETTSGCEVRESLEIFAKEVPIVDLGRDTMLCGSQPLTLNPLIDGADQNLWYQDGTLLPTEIGPYLEVFAGAKTITYEARNNYSNLLNKDADGYFATYCSATDDISILVCDKYMVNWEIPAAFTPNGDGINDKWEIKSFIDYPDVSIEIYTRWGNLIYKSTGYNASNYWDGTDANGSPLGMDSYHFIIDLHDGSANIIGNVTIVR